MLEMSFDRNGKLIRTVNQFSNGIPKAVQARLVAEGKNSLASK
jgi:hypothetical protein